MNTLSARSGALLFLASLATAFCAHAQQQTTDIPPEPLPQATEVKGESVDNKLRFSGFARLVGGYLDDSNAEYLGYGDSISFTENSLLAFQLDYDIAETLSFTTQLLGHTSEARDSGIEWAYLTYRPTERWQFKAGRLRTPFFIYSDIIDVGFAYPWVTPPQQVYNPYMFASLIGASAGYQFQISDWTVESEVYWGNFDDDIHVESAQLDTEVDDLRGLILGANRGNLRLRASYHIGDAAVDVPELTLFSQQLAAAGFDRSAASILPEGDVDAIQASVSYDEIDYFAKAEWMRISSDTPAIPQLDSYYLSAGYVFYPFTVHLTYSELEANLASPVDEIPLGVDPQLDGLRFGYQEVFNNLPIDDLNSVTLGVRYDWSPQIALKAEITHLDGQQGQRSFFAVDRGADFDRKANLYQVAIEWIF